MKLSEYFTKTSTLDSFTIRHLGDWCKRYNPSSNSDDELFALMVRHLESIDIEDRIFLVDQGWTFVFDHMNKKGENQ